MAKVPTHILNMANTHPKFRFQTYRTPDRTICHQTMNLGSALRPSPLVEFNLLNPFLVI